MLAVHALSAGAQVVYFGGAVVAFGLSAAWSWFRGKRGDLALLAIGLALATFVFFFNALAAS